MHDLYQCYPDFFIDVEAFDKFQFTDNLNNLQLQGKILYVSASQNLPEGFEAIETINDLSGKPVFIISKGFR